MILLVQNVTGLNQINVVVAIMAIFYQERNAYLVIHLVVVVKIIKIIVCHAFKLII